jgi:hypothetical protein
MGGTCSMNGRYDNGVQNYIKVDIREVGYKILCWICVARYRDK